MKNKILLVVISLLLIGKASAQWSTVYNGGSDFYFATKFINANTGYVGGQDIRKTTNGGLNWALQYVAPGETIFSFFVTGTDTIVAVGGGSGVTAVVLKTTNGGANWLSVLSGTFAPLYGVHFTSRDTGYAVGYNGLILRTVNGGLNWTQQISGTTNFLTGVYFVSPGVGFATGYYGTLLKTTNSGQTWTPLNSGTTNHLLDIHFTSVNEGYACGGIFASGSVMLKTTNAGVTWVPQIIPSSVINLHSVHFPTPVIGYAVADNGKIIKTVNGGATWLPQTSPVTSRLFKVHFPAADTGYAVGEYKIVIKYINDFSSTGNVAQADPVMNVYPNPAADLINIEVNFEKPSRVTISVIDLLGQVVKAQTESPQAGSQIIQLNTAGIANGYYLLQVQSDEGVISKRIEIIH